MTEPQAERRFHNLTLEQVQTLDRVLTEVIPIHGRGNFPTLQVRAKDIIRVVKERLVERDITVRDIRLNGATASHVLVRDNGLGYRDLDIIFGVELPRQEDFQVIKEVVLGTLRDHLPFGVNRRKITCLTMKEAYVQKMVKVFNEHDRWSLISLSNNRAKTVGLRFVSSLRRQFEFSVDSFQIILDRMLESYWETDRKKGGRGAPKTESPANGGKAKTAKQQLTRQDEEAEQVDDDSTVTTACPSKMEAGVSPEEEEEPPRVDAEEPPPLQVEQLPADRREGGERKDEDGDAEEDGHSEEEPLKQNGDSVLVQPLVPPPPQGVFVPVGDTPMSEHEDDMSEISAPELEEPEASGETSRFSAETDTQLAENTSGVEDPRQELSFPPPAKKTCSSSQEAVPDYCPLPKLQRKMSRKTITKPAVQEKWSLLSDLSDITMQMFPPIEIPKPVQPKPPHALDSQALRSCSEPRDALSAPQCDAAARGETSPGPGDQTVKPKHWTKPPDLDRQGPPCARNPPEPQTEPDGAVSGPWAGTPGKPAITVEAECMYGDFEEAVDHLRHRLIATHNPEEIRGGGLLKYSDLLVRNFKPASETEIKSLERYMCSRFFIDFPDVGEQQRKIEAYLHCHFIGNEEASKYDYLMTLRRVIDESTVCLMGHERRQTLNMITVLALRVLGEQNAIPNTANVTCFYQPAPYVSEPIYSSYFISPPPPPPPPPPQPPLVYHPYPLHVHLQSGLV